MKYSQLISFNPIEDVIQLVTAENKDKAREYVKTYVMSDSMADALQAPMIDQLQMDEVVDNKGVLVVGNYGTGKSHLMSVISAVATDADNVQYLQNEKFKQQVQPIAGKFEVLTPEHYIGLLEQCLRVLPPEVVIHRLTGDGAKRDLIAPLWSADKKRVLNAIRAAFARDDLVQGSER